MNWHGGGKLKTQAKSFYKRQKEFFEKQKIKLQSETSSEATSQRFNTNKQTCNSAKSIEKGPENSRDLLFLHRLQMISKPIIPIKAPINHDTIDAKQCSKTAIQNANDEPITISKCVESQYFPGDGQINFERADDNYVDNIEKSDEKTDDQLESFLVQNFETSRRMENVFLSAPKHIQQFETLRETNTSFNDQNFNNYADDGINIDEAADDIQPQTVDIFKINTEPNRFSLSETFDKATEFVDEDFAKIKYRAFQNNTFQPFFDDNINLNESITEQHCERKPLKSVTNNWDSYLTEDDNNMLTNSNYNPVHRDQVGTFFSLKLCSKDAYRMETFSDKVLLRGVSQVKKDLEDNKSLCDDDDPLNCKTQLFSSVAAHIVEPTNNETTAKSKTISSDIYERSKQQFDNYSSKKLMEETVPKNMKDTSELRTDTGDRYQQFRLNNIIDELRFDVNDCPYSIVYPRFPTCLTAEFNTTSSVNQPNTITTLQNNDNIESILVFSKQYSTETFMSSNGVTLENEDSVGANITSDKQTLRLDNGLESNNSERQSTKYNDNVAVKIHHFSDNLRCPQKENYHSTESELLSTIQTHDDKTQNNKHNQNKVVTATCNVENNNTTLALPILEQQTPLLSSKLPNTSTFFRHFQHQQSGDIKTVAKTVFEISQANKMLSMSASTDKSSIKRALKFDSTLTPGRNLTDKKIENFYRGLIQHRQMQIQKVVAKDSQIKLNNNLETSNVSRQSDGDPTTNPEKKIEKPNECADMKLTSEQNMGNVSGEVVCEAKSVRSVGLQCSLCKCRKSIPGRRRTYSTRSSNTTHA